MCPIDRSGGPCGISKEPSARGSEGFARILQPHPVAPWSQTKDSSAPSAPPYWVPEGFPRILQPHPMAPLPQTKDLSAAPCGFRNASAPPRWVLKDFQKSFNFSPITWHLCHRQKILQPHPGVGNASAPAHRHLKDLEKNPVTWVPLPGFGLGSALFRLSAEKTPHSSSVAGGTVGPPTMLQL